MRVYVVLEGANPLRVFATFEQARHFAAGYELAANSAYECECDIVHVPYGLGGESPDDEGTLDALLAPIVGGGC